MPTPRKPRKLLAHELKARCNPVKLGFKTTAELEPLTDFIDQERAISNLKLGLTQQADGYNIVIVDPSGSGRGSVLRGEIRETLRSREALQPPPDICYVLNLAEPTKPRLLMPPAGGGKDLRQRLIKIGFSLIEEIPALLQNQAVLEEQISFSEEIEALKSGIPDRLIAKFPELRPHLRPTGPQSVELYCTDPDDTTEQKIIIPVRELTNKPGLSAEDQKKRKALKWDIFREWAAINRELSQKEIAAQKKSQKFLRQKLEELLSLHFVPLRADFPAAATYLAGLEEYIADSYGFYPQLKALLAQNGSGPDLPVTQPDDYFLPFRVNVLVDNSGLLQEDRVELPLVDDPTASFSSIFGEIIGVPAGNRIIANHMHIHAGSLMRANGGYLILDAEQILQNNLAVWLKLIAVLKHKELEFEDLYHHLGFARGFSLEPEPIPIRVKVVVIFPSELYRALMQVPLLRRHLEHFFKVKAEFNTVTDRKDHERDYAQFVAMCVQREGLRPFSNGAVAKIIEYGARLAGNQKKLSLKMSDIKSLVTEADGIANRHGAATVETTHIAEALHNRIFMVDLAREHIHELFRDGKILFDPAVPRVGQTYGLALLNTGEFTFGIPTRITAQHWAAREGGVLSIDRVNELGDPILGKATAIVDAYLQARYAKNSPINRAIRIVFEQTYGIGGDSATAAELFAVISALAEIPLNQNLAITGSANQFGNIQAIGGVNEKIEGFFDVCKVTYGIEDKGIIVPAQNVGDIVMLRDDIIKACRQGKFGVYSISTVEEGLQLLTGRSMAEIDALVRKNLAETYQRARREQIEFEELVRRDVRREMKRKKA